MNWKIYDDKNNIFSTQNFDHVKDLNTFNGYDFIYREINHWEYSNTGCIYEMWDCLLKEGDIVHIPQMLPHQLICGEKNGAIIEFSSHHDDADSYRYEPGDSQTNSINQTREWIGDDKSASAVILGETK